MIPRHFHNFYSHNDCNKYNYESTRSYQRKKATVKC